MLRLALLMLFSAVIPLHTGVLCPEGNHECAEQVRGGLSCHLIDDPMKKCQCSPDMSPKLSRSADIVCNQNCNATENWYPLLNECREGCLAPHTQYFNLSQKKCVGCPNGTVLIPAIQLCHSLCNTEIAEYIDGCT